jgi:hypothetical protein
MKTLVTMAPCHGFFNDEVDENPPILPENSKKTECQFRYGRYFLIFSGIQDGRELGNPLSVGFFWLK